MFMRINKKWRMSKNVRLKLKNYRDHISLPKFFRSILRQYLQTPMKGCKMLQDEAVSPDCSNSSSNKLSSSDTTTSSLGISTSWEITDYEDLFLCNMDGIDIDLPVVELIDCKAEIPGLITPTSEDFLGLQHDNVNDVGTHDSGTVDELFEEQATSCDTDDPDYVLSEREEELHVTAKNSCQNGENCPKTDIEMSTIDNPRDEGPAHSKSSKRKCEALWK